MVEDAKSARAAAAKEQAKRERAEYGKRLRLAVVRKDGIHKLADHLDITYTAAKKAYDGKSMLSCTNNARAAALLGVDSDWLATGEGAIHSQKVWPFRDITPQEWFATPDEIRKGVENMVRGASR